MNDSFEQLVRSDFRFLAERYGFQVIDVEKSNYGCIVWYKNQTTVVRVSLELYDGGLFVTIYRLKDGNVPDYPIFFDPRAEFLVFDLNDLLIIRSGEKIDQDPTLIYDEKYLKSKVKQFSQALQQHADDVLRGDFEILPKLKERVARRAKELEDEQ
jgi:hypothetical protein